MQLTILGMNGPFPSAGGACSGYFVQAEHTCLQMDLGTGTLSALTALTAPEKLTALLLTHWHGDHCSDVLPLIYRMEACAAGGAQPLEVYAPVDEASPVRQAVLATKAMRLHDVKPGDILKLGEVTVRAFYARHPVPALMYRVEDGRSVLCYTGDTNTQESLPDFAAGADLLLADGLFPESMWAECKPHMAAVHCARLAEETGAKQLVITHLNPTIDPAGLLKEARQICPRAELAERGRRYTL